MKSPSNISATLFRTTAWLAMVVAFVLGIAAPTAAQTTTLSGTLSGPITFNATSGSAVISGNSTLDADVTFSLDFVADYLLVGGGGGGGDGSGGGGGGAGGFLSNSVSLLSGSYGVVVGGGGAGGSPTGTTGDASSISFLTTLAGGGGGGGSGVDGLSGASGGGGGTAEGSDTVGGTTSGDGAGNTGGSALGFSVAGGGGGGAGGPGGDGTGTSTGGDGGAGLSSDITGTTIFYAGGGGGAASGSGGTGGLGGGGAGDGSSGSANTGGGGGGGGAGGEGGSGIAIIRYLGSQFATGGVVSSGTGSADGYTLHTYTTTGPDSFELPELSTRLAATLSGNLDGVGSLTFLGPGTLTLTGSNTYTGGTTIDGGTLVVATGGSISHSSANLFVGFTGGQTGGLNITGGSVLADYAAIGYDAGSSGSLVITGGTLAISTDLYAGLDGDGLLSISGSGVATVGGTLYRGLSSTIALESGGTLQIGTGGASGSLATDLTNNGSLVFDRFDNSNFTGVIDGSGTVTTLGAGTLTFTGANTYTGVTTISSGALQLGDGTTTGSITSDVINNAMLIFNPHADLTFGNSVSGTGIMQKLGTAVLTLSGSNTYSGGTQIDAGVLSLGSQTAIGNVGVISFNGGVLQFTGSNTTDYSARFSTAAGQAFALDTNGEDVALASAISGTDSSLTKLGLGTLTISASNSYTGSTTINGGEAIVAAGGVISHSGTSLFVGTEGNTATLTISGGSVTDANASVGSGNGSIGTVAVSDGTWITLGDLIVGAAGSSAGTVTISGGNVSSENATLGYDAAAQGTVTVTGGLWTTVGNLTVGQDGTGVLTVSSSGTVLVGGTLARGTNGTISLESGGLLQIGSGTTGGMLLTDLTNNGSLVFDRSDDSAYAGAIDGVGTVTKRGAGTLTFTGINTYTGTSTISAGALQIGDGVSTGSIVGDVINNATLIFNPATDLSYANSVSGSGSLTKLGNGMLTLTGSSSYSGGTLINGGTFNIATGGAVGHGAANLVVGDASSGSLLVSGGTVTSADGIVGRGLTGAGAAAVTDGVWNITGGLQIGADGGGGTFLQTGGTVSSSTSHIGSGSGSVGTAEISGGLWSTTGDMIVGSNGTGGLTVAGSGVVEVTGTLSRGAGGTIAINAGGTLGIGTGGSSGSLATDITNDGLVVFNRANDSTYDWSMSGSGAVTKSGSGTLTFTGTNDYTGATAVSHGRLLVNGQLGNTAVTVDTAALLGGSGTILGDVAISGTLSPGNSPGVLTVGSLSLLAGSHTFMEITGTSSGLYDQIVGTGAGGLTYGGSLDLVISGSYADQATFHLFSNFTSNTDDFATVGLSATGEYAGLTFTGTGGEWTSTWTANHQRLIFSTATGDLVVVPEPSTYAMALAGLACGGWQMWRRRRRL